MFVQCNELSDYKKWEFFDSICDVNNLNPAEEKQDSVSCLTDEEELIGVVILDTFGNNTFFSRIAVKKEYRNNHIGTKLIKTVLQNYNPPYKCRIHTDNTISQNLFESVGFSKTDEDRGLLIYERK